MFLKTELSGTPKKKCEINSLAKTPIIPTCICIFIKKKFKKNIIISSFFFLILKENLYLYFYTFKYIMKIVKIIEIYFYIQLFI